MLAQLNDQQNAAIAILDGPVLVLAGAGSGKTRVVTERIVRLIASGVSPDAILGLTFTNKAAKEMQERVERMCSQKVWISTFHKLGAKILRESITALGYGRDFLILDEEDTEKIVRQCLECIGVKEGKGEIRKYRQAISKAKNAPDRDYSDELPQGLFGRYEAELKKVNGVDFDDLLLLPLKLFQEHPSILALYQSRWSYLLVDEYQDTNGVQDQLIYLLAGEKKNLFVVGDPDQAIYSWRGANIQNILNFERCYPGAEVIRLEQNYRSQSNILEAANALISHNDARYEKVLWSTRQAGHKLKRIRANDEREEAFYVTRKIAERRASGVPYREIAVLYRTNAQSRPFEDQLLARGIPYVVVGGISFYRRKEIKDILAYLRLILSDHDQLAFERTITLRKQGLGASSLLKIFQGADAEGLPLLQYCRVLVQDGSLNHPVKLSSKAKTGLQAYVEMIDRLRGASQEVGISHLVKLAIEETGYLDFLREDRETFQDRRENVDELVAIASEWDAEERGGLVQFFEELSLKASIEEAGDLVERVSLMTIHNSKGLEFELTFLAGLEEDLFPHVNARGSASALEEERRLCYVAMTRAKEELVLSYCTTRYLFGTLRHQIPSRFLMEIPREYFSD
jgi:DNA helicase-2/ATP-dependent DNA helicase PcrA